jgi:hypothetical protein
VETYFSRKSGKDLSRIFDQYLRTTMIPVLEFKTEGNQLSYRWSNTVPGFDMPVRLESGIWLKPTGEWASTTLVNGDPAPSKNFYIQVKNMEE